MSHLFVLRCNLGLEFSKGVLSGCGAGEIVTGKMLGFFVFAAIRSQDLVAGKVGSQ